MVQFAAGVFVGALVTFFAIVLTSVGGDDR